MNQRNQFQWMGLLAAAVILPTVSLLWFMSRVVANERLVIRQKLGGIYQQKLEEAAYETQRGINARFEAFSFADAALDPYGLLRHLVLEERFQGVMIWNRDGTRAYPSTGEGFGSGDLSRGGPLDAAWRLEFVEGDLAAAAARYEGLAASDPRALVGRVRCLARLERWEKALGAATQNTKTRTAPARLLLLSLLKENEASEARFRWEARLIQALEHDLFKTGNEAYASADFRPTTDFLPAEQNLLIARRFLEHLRGMESGGRGGLIQRLDRLVAAEELSIAALATFPSPDGLFDRIEPTQIGGNPYHSIRHDFPFAGEIRILLSNEGLASALDGYRAAFDGSDARLRILDAHGNLLMGEVGAGRPAIASAPLPLGFPEGRVELFFADGDLFDKAAGRQIVVYIWTGVLVIALMLVVGAFAFQAVGRQIRVNKMKNNFIATVSHELKTPLASMRLLVDTLLEGRVRDETHAREYLTMIARENERLTRMIENFLSFSRMERGKNAFAMEPTAPAAVAADAIESVCTKYQANHCHLETKIADDLPDLPADHDALVTVLINLLDNACKYTAEDKRIELSVFAEADEICFAVADNGIGLSPRQIKKIFDSFYQVDHSLARAAEGCGLGLSIVHFIVSAHKGRVEVESEPGQGSSFTARLPLI